MCFLIFGGLGAFGAADVVDRDVDALLTEPDGDGLTDTGAAAGDEGTFADESLHDLLLCADGGFGAVWARSRPVWKKSRAVSIEATSWWRRTAPNGAFQKSSPDGGPSNGPTYR